MKTCLVSVIIPSYNREHVIKDAVESVLNQTLSEIECIVVDDGSTDNTQHVLRTIADDRLVYYKLDNNRGACYARNYGVMHARGKYIAFQDSDDIWDEYKLEKQLIFLEKQDADMTFCQLKSENNVSKKVCLHPGKKVKSQIITQSMALTSFWGSTQTFFLKKECFDKMCFDINLPRYQDWDLLIQATKFFTVIYQNEPLAIQKIGQDSISVNPAKGFTAFEYLLKKYSDEFNNNLKAKSNVLSFQATFLIQQGENADELFRESIRINKFSFRHWLKWILYKVGILKYRYRRR